MPVKEYKLNLIMKTDEIKKVLYKEKPVAKYVRSTSHPILRVVTDYIFEAQCSIGKVRFVIPVADMPVFLSEANTEEAQLLIRWLVNEED